MGKGPQAGQRTSASAGRGAGAVRVESMVVAFPVGDRSGTAREFGPGCCKSFEVPSAGWLSFGVDVPDNVGVYFLGRLGGFLGRLGG